jgi:guanylate kinase
MPAAPASSSPASKSPAATGLLFVVSAPSGAGKTSLVAALLERDPALALSVSYTTRARRSGEVDGKHYHFVDHARFERMIAEGAFIEYARVFDNAYGTAESSLRETLDSGQDLLLEIDWQGARQVRERFPEAVSIFIVPPSLAALEERLRGRGQDSDMIIGERMAKARDELSHWDEYGYLVVNDRFEQALGALGAILQAERLRTPRQAAREQDRLRSMVAGIPGDMSGGMPND